MIARSAWRDHPRFDERALLLQAHDSFRNYVRYIAGGVEAVATERGGARRRRRLLARLGAHYADLQWSISVHERFEERKLYPFLETSFDVSLAWLREEHDELRLVDELVQGALAHASHAGDDELEQTRLELLRALAAYSVVLDAHLVAEEDALIPLLLSMDADAFAKYRSLPVAQGPRARAF